MSDGIFKETNPLPPRDEDDIRVYRCNNCGEKGHSRRTCGLTEEQRRANRRGKR